MARSARYYQPIQGSSRLATAPLEAATALSAVEALARGEMRRVAFDGELVGAARVGGRCASIPLEAFDAAGELLEPEEQGAYFQLLRLSYAEGRNFCRVPKRELLARLGATERRLHRILDGLVRKGLVRLLHRDNRGTAMRVYLPNEAKGQGGDDVVLPAAPCNEPAPRRLASAAVTAPAAMGATGATARTIPLGDARTRALATALAAARGSSDDAAVASAIRDVSELVADGATPRQVEAAIRAVARRRAAEGVRS